MIVDIACSYTRQNGQTPGRRPKGACHINGQRLACKPGGEDSLRLLFTKQAAVSDAGYYGAQNWRNPKEPELRECPAVDEYRLACAAGRIDGCIGDRDAYQMNERESKPDGYGRESVRRTLVGRP